MPIWFDHLLALVLLVAWPAYVARKGREETRELEQNPEQLQGALRQTIGIQWGTATLLLAAWVLFGRPFDALGLGMRLDWGFGLALALALALVWAQRRQEAKVRQDPDERARVREQLSELSGWVPKTPAERRTWRWMAVTAGVCEELVYRGFLLWYLGAYLPMALAVPAMMLAFGAAHLYQGVRHAATITLVAGGAAFFYLLSGSLWIPMALHTFVDLSQAALARAALAPGPTPAGTSELAAD